MKILISIFSVLVFSLSIVSCTKDSVEETVVVVDPNPDPDPDSDPVIDSIPNKTYTYEGDIKEIIDTNCVVCHSNPMRQGATIPLETYSENVKAVNKSDLFGRISTRNFNNIMPASGRMPDETIKIIETWIAGGLKEK